MKQSAKNDRKQSILDTALRLAESAGYASLTPIEIAAAIGCARTTVIFHYHTTAQLHRAIVGEAIRVKNLRVLAQALVANDPRAKKLPADLQRAAIESILNRG